MEKKTTADNENNQTGRIEESMTGYQTLSERKTEFIHIINNMSSQEFERLEQIFKTMSSERLPGQATVEEMRERVHHAMLDYENDQKNYYSQNELRAKFGV